jgi:cytochrome c-type biogenesis protein CcsB
VPDDAVHAGFARGGRVAGLTDATALQLASAWGRLEHAWQAQDAAAANGALATLASTLPGIEPSLYPSMKRLRWEHWYYSHDKLTGTWMVYFLAVPFLLMAAVYRFRWARRAGITIFAAAFVLHSFSIALRWYLAGRIPNSNMFEAITASSWFGAAVALTLEAALRRWYVKNLPALAAAVYAMVALMCGHFMPVALNSDIATVMPVLDRTIWLYIHTNMVIAAYALIFFGAVTALCYLLGRTAAALARGSNFQVMWAGDGRLRAGAGGAGTLILAGAPGGGGDRPAVGEAVVPDGAVGAGMPAGLARSLDGATMIFLELAFVTLFAGTVLGAVWADVSWGRPWGWDPKEVFALNTWIVLLVLVHVRLKVRDKALWTAILALLACAVMLFNWIAINFVVTGLHSYA